ncbi:hypothetical protein GCM10007857_32410 [Bradyrhizobium iriomotense]|uniref:Tetratricopeptide repeat protein n=1 Tax=Bradyrhizobium iriomotense TaxID=441950 RepID=A0ABQ6B0Y7_9BRAD|nr:hypothetical protein GCM10007857_32410 [Bradyrhizobium iriomotense]
MRPLKLPREVLSSIKVRVLYRPIDLADLPKDYPLDKLEGAKIINFEIASGRPHTERLSDVVRRDPDNALALFNRGLAQFEGNDLRAAIADFTKAIELSPNDLHSYHYRGWAYFKLEEYGAALSDLSQQIVLGSQRRIRDEKDPELRAIGAVASTLVGIALCQVGRFEEAVDFLGSVAETKVYELDADMRIWLLLAMYQLILTRGAQELHDKTIDACDEFIGFLRSTDGDEILPLLRNAYHAKADAQRQLGHIDKALDSYGHLIAWLRADVDKEVTLKEVRGIRCALLLELAQADFEAARSYLHHDGFDHQDAVILEIRKAIETRILKYYGISPEHENPSPGYDLPRRVIPEEKLREIIRDEATLLTERLSQPKDQPFPILSEKDVKAIIAHGKRNSWDERAERDWSYHTNAFKYVHIIYNRWLNRGLTREILARADSSLHIQITRKISLEGLPAWLDLPTGSEAKLRSITDPIERTKMEVVREFLRDQKRSYRSQQRKSRTTSSRPRGRPRSKKPEPT